MRLVGISYFSLFCLALIENAKSPIYPKILEFFNIFGILIIYGVKPLREIPLKCADLISDYAVKNKLIPIIYLLIKY